MLYDAVIIGGGPVGSQVAYRLSLAGHKVLVLEQKSRISEPICCTGIVSRECAEAFNLNSGVTLRRVNCARIFSPSGRILWLWRPEIQACVLDRPALNLDMTKRAQEAGAEYYTGNPVTNLEIGRNEVRIDVSNGNKEGITARSAVIASGFDTKMITKLGLGQINDFAVGVQGEVETNGLDEIEVYLGKRFAPGFFAWLVPVSAETALVGLISRHNAAEYLRELLALLVSQGKMKSAALKIYSRVLPFHPLAKTFGKRFLVVGAAAGQVKPLTGGGIYYGMLCADIAANTLHRALENDDLSAKNLAGYQKEWRKQLGSEIRTSYRARTLFEKISDKQLDKIFEIAESNGVVESLLEMEDVSFDWHSHLVKKLIREKMFVMIGELIKAPFLR